MGCFFGELHEELASLIALPKFGHPDFVRTHLADGDTFLEDA